MMKVLGELARRNRELPDTLADSRSESMFERNGLDELGEANDRLRASSVRRWEGRARRTHLDKRVGFITQSLRIRRRELERCSWLRIRSSHPAQCTLELGCRLVAEDTHIGELLDPPRPQVSHHRSRSIVVLPICILVEAIEQEPVDVERHPRRRIDHVEEDLVGVGARDGSKSFAAREEERVGPARGRAGLDGEGRAETEASVRCRGHRIGRRVAEEGEGASWCVRKVERVVDKVSIRRLRREGHGRGDRSSGRLGRSSLDGTVIAVAERVVGDLTRRRRDDGRGSFGG
jgi:hypothetical protein